MILKKTERQKEIEMNVEAVRPPRCSDPASIQLSKQTRCEKVRQYAGFEHCIRSTFAQFFFCTRSRT